MSGANQYNFMIQLIHLNDENYGDGVYDDYYDDGVYDDYDDGVYDDVNDVV
ncbi:hypothetical protein Klosneuvirus_2_234 [Klosneuvirus KNV1]|uniref:Uncharacterized protein n=1 Tax=Klosneuvirus KNV1 TaxID=1977640 RepID=A0A1V0SJJ9_9VIRU|nr:hypothetical protein Klosneuvirus_2_234 [Klosneuvirus KNV1]